MPRMVAFDRLLQSFWHRVPLNGQLRLVLKGVVFRVFAPWFRGTVAYNAWLEQRRWWRDGWGVYREARFALSDFSGAARPSASDGSPNTPSVSVIIPVRYPSESILACLDSIDEHRPQVAIEVIVVDASSDDDTHAGLAKRADVRYLRNDGAMDFGASCNRGAAKARGEFVFFLEEDMRVLDGWLDAAMTVMSRAPDEALVGSKLILPSRRIKGTRVAVHREGGAENDVRGDDPRTPMYNYVRNLDHCSGAPILVRGELFDRLGGFEQGGLTARDAGKDLCRRVRASGARVLYQPFSQVIQAEKNPADGLIHGKVFAEPDADPPGLFCAWRSRFDGRAPYARRIGHADTDPCARARLLIVDACTPMPDRDSGSIDLVNYLRLLKSLDYHVTFIPADLLYAGGYTQALQALGVECLYAPFERSVERVLRIRGHEFDSVMLMRLAQGTRYLRDVRVHCPRAKIIFNTVDLHFLREERRALTRSGTATNEAARRIKHAELDVVRGADCTIVISPVERDLLAAEVPAARLAVIPLLREIPGRGPGYECREGILFIGGFRHPPNVDAMIWFCERIWPEVHRRLPDLVLDIVGSYPTPEILRLQGHGVRVLGYVKDIEPLFSRALITIAPLRYGAGLKGKVVTSLGYGVPSVVTPTAAEGLGLDEGQGILTASEPDAFVTAIARLCQNAGDWERLSSAGLQAVSQRFSVEANRPGLARLLAELGLPS